MLQYYSHKVIFVHVFCSFEQHYLTSCMCKGFVVGNAEGINGSDIPLTFFFIVVLGIEPRVSHTRPEFYH